MAMTPEEYENRKNELDLEHRKKIVALNREYAFSHNKVKVGDIVIDHLGPILVEKIGFGVYFSRGLPQCNYYGKQLKKDLTPRKDESVRTTYAKDILKILENNA